MATMATAAMVVDNPLLALSCGNFVEIDSTRYEYRYFRKRKGLYNKSDGSSDAI